MQGDLVGAIDIGTNSVLMLIARAGEDGEPEAIVDRATITRLGQGVDATGRLADEAVERTLACVDTYAAELRERGVGTIAAVGTSAMRDAAGGERFIAAFAERVGAPPKVISGVREAQLTFEGALTGLALGAAEAKEEVAVFDIGGGSTEIIVGAGREVRQAVSLDIGAVRLTERFLASDPPQEEERAELARHVATVLGDAPSLRDLPLVGVAGTVTTLAAVAYAIEKYEGASVHGRVLDAAQLATTFDRLATLPVAERRKLPGLEPKRADVIVAGAMIAEAIRQAAGADRITVSDRGVRWGLARDLLAQLGRRS